MRKLLTILVGGGIIAFCIGTYVITYGAITDSVIPVRCNTCHTQRGGTTDTGRVAGNARNPVQTTRPRVEPSRGKAPTPTKVILLEVTAYSYTGHRTASGTWPKHGTIAADWRYFPKGTRMYIPGYGYGTVQDRGGVIEGNRPIPNDGKANLDVYMTSKTAEKNWGRRVVKVYVYQ